MKLAGVGILFLPILVPILLYKVTKGKYFLLQLTFVGLLAISITMKFLDELNISIKALEKSLDAVDDITESDISWINDCLPDDSNTFIADNMFKPEQIYN